MVLSYVNANLFILCFLINFDYSLNFILIVEFSFKIITKNQAFAYFHLFLKHLKLPEYRLIILIILLLIFQKLEVGLLSLAKAIALFLNQVDFI